MDVETTKSIEPLSDLLLTGCKKNISLAFKLSKSQGLFSELKEEWRTSLKCMFKTGNISSMAFSEDNVYHIVNLKYLYCSNTSLSNLDVSKNVNLVALHCDNTKLINLDLSKNVNLEYLNCDNTVKIIRK